MAAVIGGVLQVGFSVAVAAYLLVKTTAALDRLTAALHELRSAVTNGSKEAHDDIKEIKVDIHTIADAARRS